MLKNLSFKNSVLSSLFGISMLTTLVGCGEKPSSGDFFNLLVDSDYNVVQLNTSQFEILNTYAEKVKYKNENVCYINDDENGVFIYAADYSGLGLNSKSTDKNILTALDMYFLDDKITFSTKKSSSQYKQDGYTKIIFDDLEVTNGDTKQTFYGKLSIMDYGQNESFVLTYSLEKDVVDGEYIIKSLKEIRDGANLLVVSEIPNIPIDNLDVTYEKVLAYENEQVKVEEIPTIEPNETLDASDILKNTKTFRGDFFSFNGYYDLKKIEKNDDVNYGSSYLYSGKDYIIGIDVVSLNEVNNLYGDAKSDEEKVNYIVDFYRENGDIDLYAIYDKKEILDCYNISISNGIFAEYLTQYGVENTNYSYCEKEHIGDNDWIIVKDFESNVTKSNYTQCKVAFAFTVDENSNSYMISFIYTPNMELFINETLSKFHFNSVEQITISDNQMQMYGEFLNVQG